MVNARFLLLGALLLVFSSYEVDALECSFGGLMISCPTAVDDSDKIFCCKTSVSNFHVCCNVEDYMRENGPMIAGIVIGALVLICICTLCSCCFCSCCLLAKRRQRGTVLYGPLSGAQVISSPPSSYSVAHQFPPSQFSSPPPPYQPTTVPNEYAQEPKNTYYQPQQ